MEGLAIEIYSSLQGKRVVTYYMCLRRWGRGERAMQNGYDAAMKNGPSTTRNINASMQT